VKLAIEVAIDIDRNRRVWMVGSADDVKPDEVEKVAPQLVEATTSHAVAAHAAAVERLGVDLEPDGAAIARAAAEASGIPASERPKRPEDPDTMRTFGEDDDDDAG
jgi:hypothetical protein